MPWVTLFLCGDVMLGRGIDQLLAHPGSAELREDFIRDAGGYLELVEQIRGPLPRPVEPGYVWGEALEVLEAMRPAARLVNLETAVTANGDFWPGKGIHYRMHPDNLDALTVAGVDACALANNHLLDFGHAGLLDTLRALERRGIAWSGAGRDWERALEPACIPLPNGGRLHFLSVGHASSGIPGAWSAGARRPGLAVLSDLSLRSADTVLAGLGGQKGPGDLWIASIHWGPNWGYEIGKQRVAFARRLVEGGVDLVHGHSSHHPVGMEVHRGRLILYGCGDFIDDYEGIGGFEHFRDDLRLMVFPTLDGDGRLERLRLHLLRSERLRLVRASLDDTRWMARTLTWASRSFGTRVRAAGEGELEVTL